jgi:uncharacterized circularly permuted ATP-grasp superfamily protein/uncharacterized alpha-E superfamily protein
VTIDLNPARFVHYPARDVGVDEAVDNGAFREHWGRVGPAIDALGIDELQHRQQDLTRLLGAEGVTYRRAGSVRAEPWKLDAIPMVVASAEWAGLEAGVAQRAVLLDLVLRDIYGEQKLLQRGVVPPEIVFGHPGFLRASADIASPDGRRLFTYGVDLGRDVDGSYRVLGDHAQAPSGAGYALENRVALSRVFPSLYRNAQVHQVAPYFRTFRSMLQAAAPEGVDDPRVVVLSPGTHSETAFEHAFLASSLGLSLVEGSDLVVRDGSVFIRSLGHLEPVDVILRRVDADYCDPLELRPESHLGVPGLLEACRRGNVTVVNPIGSSAIENPALHGFLGAASKALLGQDLLLESVESWWCGEPSALEFVIDHLDELVVKPVVRDRAQPTRFGDSLSSTDREQLVNIVRSEPRRWVAQRPLTLATTPTLTAEGIRPRRTILRTYAVARDESFVVMPGGLTRVAHDEHSPLISNQIGAVSKDTWVLASEPEPHTDVWLQGDPSQRQDSFAALSERAAENLFWVGRYAERAESVVRLMRAVHDRRNGETAFERGGSTAVQVLLEMLSIATYTTPGFLEPERRLFPDAELFSLASDAERNGSLAHAVTSLLGAADAVRDQLSVDTWQVTSSLEQHLETLATTPAGRQDVVQGTLGEVMGALLALHGLAGESMVRDAGWYFMEAGRRVERFQHLALLLKTLLEQRRGTEADGLVLESVLLATESIITYRRRYRSHAKVEALLELLVDDPSNPRSMRYQVDRLVEAVGALPGNRAIGTRSPEEVLVAELSDAVRGADSHQLDERHEDLVALLDRLLALSRSLSEEIAERSFDHTPPQHSLTDVSDEMFADAGRAVR